MDPAEKQKRGEKRGEHAEHGGKHVRLRLQKQMRQKDHGENAKARNALDIARTRRHDGNKRKLHGGIHLRPSLSLFGAVIPHRFAFCKKYENFSRVFLTFPLPL